MSDFRLNRQQLAQFLSNPQAIRAFEQLFDAVKDTIPTDLEGVQLGAEAAQQQAAEALSSLAVVAEQLAQALLQPIIAKQQEDEYSFGQSVDFSNLLATGALELYVPPSEPNNFHDPKNVNISGGYINGTSIGATAPSSGIFTSLSASGAFSLTGDQVQIAEGGTGATTAANARTNLGLGTVATQNSNNVNITGGVINGVSYVVANRTDSSDVANFKVTGAFDAVLIVDQIDAGTNRPALALRKNGTTSGKISADSTGVVYYDASLGATPFHNFFIGGSHKFQVNSTGARVVGDLQLDQAAALVKTVVALNNGAAAAIATLTNAPIAGNPTKWIPISDNGTTRYIPTW